MSDTWTMTEESTSLRDQFAMAAMQGMLSACDGPAWGRDMFPLAESAYKYADQMLVARALPKEAQNG